MNKPELLSPAGSLKKLKIAIDYGADAVYLGGKRFSLRSASDNFTEEQMAEGIAYCHERGKKAYIALNIVPHNRDLAPMAEAIAAYRDLSPDAFIISDPGTFMMAKEIAPDIDIHISTQGLCVNKATVDFWQKQGAKRVVLARELSLEEIREIYDATGAEIETFVHGAMCISYSGRCLLSNYMAARDGNGGACAHPCRWKYTLIEEKRPGEAMPITEDEHGTYIFNSRDMNMIAHVPEMIAAGIASFKIEGRVKSEFYVATVTKAYREAIDACMSGKPFDPVWEEELTKVSHRSYCTGFYFGPAQQIYETSSYIRNYELIGTVESYDADTKIAKIRQKNRFFDGDTYEILQPGKPYVSATVHDMKNEEGEPITVAPHPEMTVYMPIEEEVCVGAMLRKRKENQNA